MENTVKLFKISKTFIVGIVLSVVGSSAALLLPIIIKNFLDTSIERAMISNLRILIVIFSFMLVNAVLSALSDYMISVTGDKRIAELRLEVQKHLLNLPLKFYEDKRSGELSSRVLNDALIIKSFTTDSLPEIITSVLMVAGSLCILLFLDLKLTIIIISLFFFLAIMAFPIGKLNEKLSIKIQNKLSQLSGTSTESLLNVKAIKLNNAQSSVICVFQEKVNGLFDLSKKVDKIFAITGPVQTLFTLFVILSIIIYGGARVKSGTLSIGTLVSFLIYIFQVIGPINSIANFYIDYTQAKGATQKINEILNEKAEKVQGTKNVGNKIYDISTLRLKNICFGYGEKKQVISKVNLVFNPGTKVALVGPSGSGKTTLINLITRLYDLDSGHITLGNKDSSLFNLYEWRDMFATVTQDNSIISGTVYSNLVFGMTDIPTEREMWHALFMANLSQDIARLPLKLEEPVGEMGNRLSGGQRQRLQIARAILRKPKFLILDEATSNLDSDSEEKVNSSLNECLHQTTVITIAHRLSTVVDADNLYFIEHGTVLGQGTHTELIHTVPAYKKFVTEQLLKTEE